MTPELPPNPRAELEAKVTPWLLGELSAEEAASVREMIANDAELAKLRDRLSVTLNLLRETIATPVGETPAQPAPLKLSPERREKLLASFKTIAPKEFAQPPLWKRYWWVPLAAAASVALLVSLIIPNFTRARTTSHQNAVVNNLRLIDSAKQQWALERRQPATAVPTMKDLTPYLGHGAAGELPTTPGDNGTGNFKTTYALGPVGQPPVAEVNGKIITLPGQEGNLAALDRNVPTLGMTPPTSAEQYAELKPAPAAAARMPQQASRRTGSFGASPSENKPTPEPAPGQIVLPQNNDQLSAQQNYQNNAVGGQANANSDIVLNGPHNEDRVIQSQTPANTPAAVRDGLGTANFYKDADNRRVFAAADEKAKSKVETSTDKNRSQTTSPEDDGVFGGGGGGGIGGRGNVAAAGDSVKAPSQKDQLVKEEAQEHWRQLPPAFSPPAKKSLPAPAGVASASAAPVAEQEAARTRSEGSIVEQITSPTPVAEPAPAYDVAGGGGAPAHTAAPAPTHAAERMRRYNAGPISANNGAIGIQGGTAPAASSNAGLSAAPAVAASTNSVYSLSAVGYINLSVASNYQITTVPLIEAPAAPAAPTPAWSAKLHAQGNTAGGGILQQKLQTTRSELTDAPLPHPALPAPVPQPEVLTRTNAFTTFSLNISDVAFKLAAASLENGVMPDAASMRNEEFINAFDYRDPEPAPGAPIGFAWEQAGDPFAHNRDLLRFSIKTAAQGRQAGRPLNLVLLLDKSGSMERADRVEIIANALRVLASQLQPNDTLSVVVFARTARLFADGVPGSEAGNVARKLRDLTPEGGTNLEEAMRLAYETALRHYLANGENRVVLLTDGAANLGNVDPNALKQRVETNHKQGIAFDCFGVGWDGYNDNLLETLSRAGNGRYGFINTPQEAATEFAGKLAGALRVAAADVKVQVEFNPSRITAYRQIGYAKDQLKKEDFRDNSVKAAQIGAAESGNALYTVQINPAGEGPIATVHVRFRVPGTGDYQEHEWTVPYTGSAVPLEKASPAMRLTATAAAFSEWLSGSPYAGEVTPDRLLGYLRGVPQVYGADARPTKLEWMIRQAKSISGK